MKQLEGAMSTQILIFPQVAAWLVTSDGREIAKCNDEHSSIALARALARWASHLGYRCDITFCDRNDTWFNVLPT